MKTLQQRIADGELFDTEAAAEITGYSQQYLRRLCKERKMGHLRRGHRYYFTRKHIQEAFKPIGGSL